MNDQTTSRRDRLRAQASAEIKTIALELMADGGPDAISLRAIARQMGMTAGAIYGYFPTRDDLITTLIRDVHTSLVDALEAARDTVPRDDPAGRILAWALAFREWALANPQGFRLIYGDPVPGYQVPEGGAAPEAEHRTCMGLTGLVAGAWPQAERIRPTDAYDWTDFEDALVRWRRTHHSIAVRMLGDATGSGYSEGTPYLKSVIHLPVFDHTGRSDARED